MQKKRRLHAAVSSREMARVRTPLAISQLIPVSCYLSLNAPYDLPWKGPAGLAVGLADENSASARSPAVAAPNEAYFAHSVGEPRWDYPAGWALGLAGENSASARSPAVAAPNGAYFAHSAGEPRWDYPGDAFRLIASADAFPMTGSEVDCS